MRSRLATYPSSSRRRSSSFNKRSYTAAMLINDTSCGHLDSLGWDVTDGCLNVVGNPLNEVGRVLVDNVQHLLVDFLGRHTSTEENSTGQVASMTWIGSTHHVLGIKALLSKLRNSKSTTWEGNHVHCELSEIAVELTWEAKAARSSTHCRSNEMVQISVCWSSQLECTEADVVQGLIVKSKALVCIFDELMDGEGSIVRLYDSIRHLG
eukprot:scaffold226_cov185-Alexandrium_tamarense.AAC.3